MTGQAKADWWDLLDGDLVATERQRVGWGHPKAILSLRVRAGAFTTAQRAIRKLKDASIVEAAGDRKTDCHRRHRATVSISTF